MLCHRVWLQAVVAALTLAGGGCASTGQPPSSTAALDNLTKVDNLPGKPACFWKSSFEGDWTVLNESTLIVHAPLPKDIYVIKLFEPVFGLKFKEGLALEDREHTGQICNDGDDYLLVPGWQPHQVPIIAVHALTTEEQAHLLQAAGNAVPKQPTANQPAPAKQ
jgi:hypothetical protein